MSSQIRKARVAILTRVSVFFVVILGLCLSILLLPSRVSTQATETCVQPPSGIIAWWPLDETSGTAAEDIIGGLDGVHVNGTSPATGQVDGSLSFDGVDDYVGVGDSDAWAFGSSNFAIELWAKFNSPGGGTISHPSHIFIGNDEGPGTQNKWFFALGGGFLNFHVNGPVVGSHFFPLAPFSPTLNQWYHLAVTRNGNVWTIYVNGVVVGSEVRSVEVPNANAPLTIGQAEQLGFMNGLLDEVAVYNRALTQSELQAIFNAGSEGKCKTLSISTMALSAIQLGTFSTQTLEARFGSMPLNWTLVDGILPSGMTLTTDGVVSGTPTVAGSFPVTIRVSDGLNRVAEKTFTLDVLLIPPPSNIRIHKTGTLAVPGRILDYFILVENIGDITVESIVVVEILDPPAFFTLIGTNPTATLIDGPVIYWMLPKIEPGRSIILSYSVRLDSSVSLGTNIPGASQVCPICPPPIEAKHLNDAKTLGSQQCKDCLQTEGSCRIAISVCDMGILSSCRDAYNMCQTKCSAKCGDLLPQVNNSQTLVFGQAACTLTDSSDGCYDRSQHDQPARGAIDPNEKGIIAKRFIQPDQLLVYPIHFENIGDIEARDVFVTDALDPNLDSSTLNLLTPAGGSFDVATRTVRWDLLNTNLDPGATGNVLLSIRPRPGLPSGTIIRNSATIQFEVFQPIVTNEVVNIIDSTRPAGAVNPLPPETSTLNFPISWNGSDAIGEIDFYSIFVSVDGGPFTPFLERTRDSNATFTGEVGKTYGFLAIATDTAGNIEVQPAIAEASTRIVTSCSTGDIEPPTVTTPSASPQALWPPDHAMREVTLNYAAVDNCGSVNCTITNITSNEPVNGTGDGDTAPDWEVVDARHVRLSCRASSDRKWSHIHNNSHLCGQCR